MRANPEELARRSNQLRELKAVSEELQAKIDSLCQAGSVLQNKLEETRVKLALESGKLNSILKKKDFVFDKLQKSIVLNRRLREAYSAQTPNSATICSPSGRPELNVSATYFPQSEDDAESLSDSSDVEHVSKVSSDSDYDDEAAYVARVLNKMISSIRAVPE